MAAASILNNRLVRDILKESAIALPNGLKSLKISRPGSFHKTTLPKDFEGSDLVVFIPAYNRQLAGDGKSLGTLPRLVRDLAEAGAREGVGITVLISDDSREREAALNEIVLGVALDTVDKVPDIYLVGRQERGITFEGIVEELERNLRDHLSCNGTHLSKAELDYHMNTLQFLATHHGYGPQRVRGHAMTMGITQPVMSRDSDSLLLNVHASHLVKPSDSEEMNAGFRFVYVNDAQEHPILVHHNPKASFLKHAVKMKVGSTLAEIQKEYPQARVYRRVQVTKDEGMRKFLENPSEPIEFRIEACEESHAVPGDTRLISVMDLVWGAPDINGHSALLDRIISGKERLKLIALPAGSAGLTEKDYPGILVKETTNPTCVEVSSSREARYMIPWLVSNPSIVGKGSLLIQSGIRAEDQIKANNKDPTLMLAYSNSNLYHSRAQEGREEDVVETFLSEDFGDMVAAIVRRRCSFSAAKNCWCFDKETLFADEEKSTFRSRLIEEELSGQVEYTWSRIEGIRKVIVREIQNNPPHRIELENIAVEMNNRCTTSFNEFRERAHDFLLQQTRFVESVFIVYPVLMESLEKVRHNDKFFAQKWRRTA